MPLIRFLRRKWLLSRPFPDSRQKVLENRVPYYRHLPEDLRQKLKNRISIFMDEKIFEGCGGLEMTDEIKVVISAYACLLILEEPSGYYPDLKTILVYPDDYIAPVHQEDEGGIVHEGMEARKGESWNLGSIVLSWNDIHRNLYEERDGQNLILHEFAHQIDERFGLTAGVDPHGRIYTDNDWNRILASAYRKLRKRSQRGQADLLDSYGAEHPAEFFSVATEIFFERPHQMRLKYPELYSILTNLYKLDPARLLPVQ